MTLSFFQHPILFASHIPSEIQKKVLESYKFRKWYTTVRKGYEILSVDVDAVYMWGEKVGFVLARMHALHNGKPMPESALIRGDGVGVLVVLRDHNNALYSVLTEQPRLCCGNPQSLEIPAGMMDESHDPKDMAIKELHEEIWQDFPWQKNHLMRLGSFFPSSGSCDEEVHLYAYVIDANEDTMKSIRQQDGKSTGHPDEPEYICPRVVPLNDVPHLCSKDAKTMMAWNLFHNSFKDQSNKQ